MTQKGPTVHSMMRAFSANYVCLTKSPSLFGEGLGRGFYYAIQLVTPSVVATAVSMLTMS